ncbi:MAG: hypothetical protein ABSB74_20485 [Tepidisphaeraceae bacterium]
MQAAGKISPGFQLTLTDSNSRLGGFSDVFRWFFRYLSRYCQGVVEKQKTFQPLRRAAMRLGLPPSWLRAEVIAGRIPALRVGKKILVNPEAVERVLLDRAGEAASAEPGSVNA